MSRYELRAVGVFDRELDKVITPADPEWASEYHVWLADPANVPDPMPIVQEPAAPFNFKAAGRARTERNLKRLAQHDALAALLKKEGLA